MNDENKQKLVDTTPCCCDTDKQNCMCDKDNTKKEELKTEVTSIAQEEEKTGQKIEVPSPEEIKNRAAASFISSRAMLSQLFKTLSSKQKNRVLDSILDIPTDGLPVLLKTNEEKQAFALGQRIISDRFLITYYHIAEQQKEMNEKVKKDKQTEEKTENKEGEKNG